MIRFLEHMTPELRDELQAFCAGSVFGVKALGPVLSYGLGYDFVTAWEQRDEAGHLTAFLSKYYGTVTVHLSPLGDVPEVHAFLRAIGFGALVGPADVFGEYLPEGETGCVMSLPKGSACIAKTAEPGSVELAWDGEYRSFYDVLTGANPGYVAEDYGEFLTDFSHRVRHGTASSVLLKAEGSPVSTAAALVITEADVFLGAVSTLPEARGHRYAGTCIRALCDRFPDRRIFLMCRPDKRAFYEHLGFEKTDDYLEVASSRK